MPDQNQPNEEIVYPRAILDTIEGRVVVGPLPIPQRALDIRVEINARRHASIVVRDDGRIEISFTAGGFANYLIKPVAGNCIELVPSEDWPSTGESSS